MTSSASVVTDRKLKPKDSKCESMFSNTLVFQDFFDRFNPKRNDNDENTRIQYETDKM